MKEEDFDKMLADSWDTAQEAKVRADERQKLLAEISELVDKMPAFTMTNPHNNHPANAYKLIDKVELRAKLAEMGEGNDAR